MQRVLMFLWLCLLLLSITGLMSLSIDQSTAQIVANQQLIRLQANPGFQIVKCDLLNKEDVILGYVFLLQPTGYIVTSADDNISPIIAYSLNSEFTDKVNNGNILADILTADLANRLQYTAIMPESLAAQYSNAWQVMLDGRDRPPMQQWPPEGTTNTGGWVKTRWNQSAPYNSLCPMDNATGNRSIAGCPAVAMGQIVAYHESINGTVFTDADDYHHNYGGNNYWIDNDSTAFGFPSFPRLNGYLDTAMHHYRYQEDITNQDKAAIIFGCGVAATQVFGSAGSGTFSVNQAMDAYERFNFTGMELLMPPDTTVTTRMIRNMMEARPVHYAIVTPAVDAGHNVVVDGYNTDGFFHVNFGWGGQYDGWYMLPSGLPYNLTVLEGAIVDISPYRYAGVFPESVNIMTMSDALVPHEIMLWNESPLGDITVEAYDFDEWFAYVPWVVNGLETPVTLAYGENITFSLQVMIPLMPRDTLETNFRIILDNGVVNIPIRWNEDVQDADDNTNPYATDMFLQQNYPNPFKQSTTVKFYTNSEKKATLSVYNLKGEKVRSLLNGTATEGTHAYSWDGKNDSGESCSSGMYLYKLKSVGFESTKRMLLIK